MQVKLRAVGNSVGLTIPNSELKRMDARLGDVVEIEIKRVVRHARVDWDNADRWQGADKEPLLLDGLPAPDFDRDEHGDGNGDSDQNKDWQW